MCVIFSLRESRGLGYNGFQRLVPGHGGFQCSCCRKLCAWSLRGWTGSDSSRRPDALAWCRWKAWRGWWTDSWKPETFDAHSCHPKPTKNKKYASVNSIYIYMYWHFKGLSFTWTSKVKYFLRFLMIMTRKGSLMPKVFCGSAGHVMYVVLRVCKQV